MRITVIVSVAFITILNVINAREFFIYFFFYSHFSILLEILGRLLPHWWKKSRLQTKNFTDKIFRLPIDYTIYTFYFFTLCYQEEPCYTPSRANGTWISIQQYPTLLNLSSRSVWSSNQEFLKQSQCGCKNEQALVN